MSCQNDKLIPRLKINFYFKNSIYFSKDIYISFILFHKYVEYISVFFVNYSNFCYKYKNLLARHTTNFSMMIQTTIYGKNETKSKKKMVGNTS